MRKGGLEPPRYCYRQPLKLVRLPIPPLPQVSARARDFGGPTCGCRRLRLRRRRRCPGRRRRSLSGAGPVAGAAGCAGVVAAGLAPPAGACAPEDGARPPLPEIASASAPTMKSAAHTVVDPRQQRRARPRTERGLAAAAAKR